VEANGTQYSLFVDAELARALEQAEAEACLAFCETAARLYPSGGIRSVRVAGGTALFYGASDPLNAVKGPGLGGPVVVCEWDAAEAMYQDSGSPVVVDLCPLADQAFVALLMRRGYSIGSFETVTVREIGADLAVPPAIKGLQVRVVGADEANVWGRVLDVGFANGGEPVKFAVDIGAVRAAVPDSIQLLATIDGVPAGGAGMTVKGKVALMSGAAVLPAFRGRGIQQALTATRLRLARERGASVAKLDVLAGSGSYCNAVRGGFQVAYTRPQLVRKWHAV
jgi:ribosomal protein S18 acetylase RimI-like enzyme